MIPTTAFGRTGQNSSRSLLGAAAFSKVSQAAADAALEHALEAGVNHVDTAASYGESERRLGSWIRRHGRPFFLATKTGQRNGQAAYEELQRSLERLGVSQVDLLQLHNLVDEQEWQVALGPGGALEAAIGARQAGLVRFIGITGHGWSTARMHLRALEVYDFDSVLLPWSYTMAQRPEYCAEFEALLKLCRERQVAVQTIKSIVRAPWSTRPHTRNTWYEPLEDQAEIDLAVHWVLGHADLFVNTAADIHLLPKILKAASSFVVPPTDAEMQAQLQRLALEPLFT
jgi:aryl-alcohol dehydrogenase-like predicted oxidoreductase